MAATTEELRHQLSQRRLERMRQGQKACHLTRLLSDTEFRVALVPLLEREYDECLLAVALMDVPDNIAGAGLRDRQEQVEVLSRSIRNPNKLEERIFNSSEQMTEALEIQDITHLYDEYTEMTHSFSPHVAQLTEEEIDFLKNLWQTLQLNGLSGRQLYALNRFISSLSPSQRLDSLHGSSLMT